MTYAACMDRAFRIESCRDARAICRLRRLVDTAGLSALSCELFEESALTRDDVKTIAGLSALLFAVNLVTIKYSHEARMYPLMLAAILAQVAMFLRALRIGGLANYAAVVVLTALAIASNFAALLIPATEGLWLAVYNRARWMAPRQCDRKTARG